MSVKTLKCLTIASVILLTSFSPLSFVSVSADSSIDTSVITYLGDFGEMIRFYWGSNPDPSESLSNLIRLWQSGDFMPSSFGDLWQIGISGYSHSSSSMNYIMFPVTVYDSSSRWSFDNTAVSSFDLYCVVFWQGDFNYSSSQFEIPENTTVYVGGWIDTSSNKISYKSSSSSSSYIRSGLSLQPLELTYIGSGLHYGSGSAFRSWVNSSYFQGYTTNNVLTNVNVIDAVLSSIYTSTGKLSTSSYTSVSSDNSLSIVNAFRGSDYSGNPLGYSVSSDSIVSVSEADIYFIPLEQQAAYQYFLASGVGYSLIADSSDSSIAYQYSIPFFNYSRTFLTGYSDTVHSWFSRNTTYIFSFIFPERLNNAGTHLYLWNNDGDEWDIGGTASLSVLVSFQNYSIVTFKFTPSESMYLTFWPYASSSVVNKILPLYYGLESTISDDLARMIGLESKTESLLNKIISSIVDGNTQTNESVSSANTQKDSFDSASGEYDALESGFVDSFNSNMSGLDLSNFNISALGTDLSTTAAFVKTSFETLINNQFGVLLGFSLVLGLAMLLFGRRL